MSDLVEREAVLRTVVEQYSAHNELIPPWLDFTELPSVTPSRYVNCEIAEHDGNGCLGYSHYGDDFPVKECLHCPKYTSYEEE